MVESVEAIKIQKCSFHKKYMNVYGQIIHLFLMKQDNIIGVTLKNHSHIRLEFIIYILGIILNIVSFQFHLIRTTTFSFIVVILAVLMYVKLGSVTEETLIAIEPLGYQINTKYIMGQKSTFIPYEQVQNIFINEVIFQQKIIYLLTILIKGSTGDQLIPLFMDSKPRINCLEYIFKELQKNRGYN